MKDISQSRFDFMVAVFQLCHETNFTNFGTVEQNKELSTVLNAGSTRLVRIHYSPGVELNISYIQIDEDVRHIGYHHLGEVMHRVVYPMPLTLPSGPLKKDVSEWMHHGKLPNAA